MIQIQPYARFNRSCREAMEHYREIFGGELELQIVKDTPMADQWPADVQDLVLHASLTGNGFAIYGSDMVTADELTTGNAMAFSLACDTETEAQQCFDLLAEGGTIVRPLHRFYAGTIGVIIDRFGKEWILYSN